MANIKVCTFGPGKGLCTFDPERGFKSYSDLYHCWRQRLVMKKDQMFRKHGFAVQTFLLQQQA